MASVPADPIEILQSSTEKNNYTRLTRLLIGGGTFILRESLDNEIPSLNFAHVLMLPTVLGRLEWLRDRHIITSEQWNSLFPTDTSCGKYTDFDVTLIFNLLREFCSLTPPPKGWDKLPDDTDLTLPADLARIKNYRNVVYAHRVKIELEDSEFQDLWKRIKDALLRIVKHYNRSNPSAVLKWETAIEKLLKDPLDIRKSHEEHEKLKTWCNDDPDVPLLKDENARLKNQVTRLESSLAHCSSRFDAKAYPVEQQSKKEALIIGAAVVGPVILDGVETVFPFLDGVIEEGDKIASMLGVRALLSAYVTKPVVIKRLQEGAPVVHIAAHSNLENATIVLAPSPEIRATKIPDEEDYILTMDDVQQAQVRAQLVVLCCSDSGRGEIKAEGVVGMCRAFLASGARAVVGSLWAINDNATRMFMKKFYKYLKDGKSASTSLNLTMKDMRSTSQYSEPKYWAPFFLMGDDVMIQF